MRWSLWLAPPIAIGTALRVLSPTRLALWRDEAQFVGIAAMPDPHAILSFLYHHESHPPLFYLLGHFLGTMAGGVEQAIGVLSLVASLLAVVAAYWLAASAFSTLAGVLAAMGTAVSVPLVLHSVQHRPYALLALMFIVSTAGLWQYLRWGSRTGLSIWATSSLTALYTHHTAVLVVVAQGLYMSWCVVRSWTSVPWRRREIVAAAGIVALLWLPGAMWLIHQATVAGYPAMHPIRWDGPPRLLLIMMLDYPLEVLLPIVLAVAGIVYRMIGHSKYSALTLDGPAVARGLLYAVAPGFLALATLGNYRSALLTPHVVLAVAPLGMVMIGGRIADMVHSGRRICAALLLEGAIVSATIGAVLHVGFVETTAPEIAAILDAEGEADDLVVLAPGVMGASLNPLSRGTLSQVDFPFEGRVRVYPFDHDFDKLADPQRWEKALDSIYAAFSGRRRVWLVSDARWISSYVKTPESLSADSLKGIGQADRARANGFYRYLRWLYGPPVAGYGTSARGRGPELMAAWLFAPTAHDSGVSQ